MAFEFKMPDIGEGIHEGEIVEWLVSEGDQVDEDQDIVEVMTDKATVQISSPRAGTIQEIRFQEGDVVDVGDVFVVIHVDGEPAATDTETSETTETEAGTDGEGEKEEKTLFELPGDMGSTSRARRPARKGKGKARAPTGPGGQVLAMPMVRQEAQQQGVDLVQVEATGSHGHVTLEDLRRFIEQGGPQAGTGLAPAQRFETPSIDRSDALEVQPIKGLRKRISENMTKAKTLQAHFTYVLEVRVDKLVEIRSEAKQAAEEQGVKLTYLPFIVKACVRALRKHPRINALIDEGAQELVLKEPINMGIAAQTDKGLVVPVVHDADKKTLLEIAEDISELAEKANNQKLSLDDIQGGTFTITSLGRIGGLLATPILAHPQVAIMGVHEIRDEPVVEDGEIVPGKIMNLSFTFDHRIIDGYDGAVFANEVKRFLEDPNLLLLESR